MSKKYDKLLSPIKLGHLNLPNRIVKTGASTGYCDKDGFVTARLEALYEKLAEGGAGLIFFEGSMVMEWHHEDYRAVGIWSDDQIPGLKKVVDKVHKHNGKIIIQLHVNGPIDLYDPISSSALAEEEIPLPSTKYVKPPREVTIEEIKGIKEDYRSAARRAKEAGFDGVEVHCAHGYFMASFLSRTWNKRTDLYGCQSLENRARLACEVIRTVKKQCGPNFVVGIRMNGEEYSCDERTRLTSVETVGMAKLIEAAGAQYINVAGYGFNPKGDKTSIPFLYMPDYFPYPEPLDHEKAYIGRFKSGLFTPSAAAIHKAVKVPVICVGRIDENMGEEIIQQDRASLIGLNRALFADPELPKKLAEGRLDDIVHCTRCGTCEDPLYSERRCRVNPALGTYDLDIRPAKKKRKVLVVGGGPAGMEVARVAALRGHAVTLVEKSRLGGRLFLAAMIKGTDLDNVLPIIEYLTTQLKKLDVDVKLGNEVNKKYIEKLNPDVVVIAVGGKYARPDIPGVKDHNVVDVDSLSKLVDIPLKMLGPKVLSTLSNIALPGIKKKVIILGGQIGGLQAAVFLTKRGKQVTVLEPCAELGEGIPEWYRYRTLPWFEKKGVRVIREVKYEQITDKGIFFTTKEGTRKFVDGGTVMVIPSQTPNDQLKKEIGAMVSEVYMAGSCNGQERGLIEHALADGRRIGCSL